MKRNKKKSIKFMELDELKEFEKPLVDKARVALSKEKMTATDKIAVRDFAVISLVYSCALRISEACKLTMNNIDLEKKIMYVVDGKGGDRTVSIPEPTIKILQEWLDIRPQWKNKPYFFTNVKGTTRPGKVKPLTMNYYNKLLKRIAEFTGVRLRDGSMPHPHTLRHTRAMELYDNNVALPVLQALLGHKSLEVTQIYAEVRNDKIISAQQTVVGGIATI